MTRTRTLFAFLAPALVAGGIVAFSATSTRADRDDDDEAEREADQHEREAERHAREAERHAREAHKQAAKEARKQVKAARQQVKEQLAEARQQLKDAPIPDKLKKKILDRLQQAAENIDRRMGASGSGDDMDMEDFEAEMEAMGEELEAEMEALGEEFESFGEGWEEWAKQFDDHGGGAIVIDPDSFDFDSHGGMMVIPTPPTPPSRPTPPTPPSVDIDLSDLDIVIDVQDLSLGADQVEQLHIIFQDEQDVLEPAREKLADLSEGLRTALEDPDASEQEIGKMVDAISAEEAKIRKAQILAWVKSRKLLDGDQRDKVQGAKIKVKKARAPRRVR